MAALQSFLGREGIEFAVKGSREFPALQKSFTGPHNEAAPRAIVTPRTEEQVQTTVAFCIAEKIPIVVRGGAHDMFGRFTALDAVCIDLRHLSTIKVSDDKKTAKIGGGVTGLPLLEELAKYELQVPVGGCGFVGYTGWCMAAGFGPYVHSYGLGADQIVGARVVNAKGQLVQADSGMVKGLRGGGGNLGVVVELEIRTYPLLEIQAGVMMMDPTDLKKTMTTFLTNYDAMLSNKSSPIPRECYIMPLVSVVPGIGRALICGFVWNGPASDESRAWIERTAALAPLMPGSPEPHQAVQPTSVQSFSTMVQTFLAPETQGRLQSTNLHRISSKSVAILAEAAEALPLESVAACLNIHTLRADSPSCSADVPDSVCPYREPHIMIELIGVGIDEQSGVGASEWALKYRDELLRGGDASERTYAALTDPRTADVRKMYGDKLDELMELKRKYDPDWVFANAVPKLPKPE